MAPATCPVDPGAESDDPDRGEACEDEVPVALTNIREIVSRVSAVQNGSSGVKATSVSVPDSDDEIDNSAPGIMSSRAYQLEMLDQSLKDNVIIAMDTGSGKTHVAVLRIIAELQKSPQEKIVWFLAPTVSLCSQQFDVIKLQTGSTPLKLLTGNDNVDNWLARTWAAVLAGTRVIVSTPQVMLDALTHAFVKMSGLALIVFDEAHNCVKKNAGGKIMDFYHRQKQAGGEVPAILGLTASPSMRSEVGDLEALEARLDAKCVSPTLHREELIKCVKRPQISLITYATPELHFTPSMQSLENLYQSLDICQDPYVSMLRSHPTERNQRALSKVIEKNDTFSMSQMKAFCLRSKLIAVELGVWAADRYIWMIVSAYLDRIASSKSFFDLWRDDEKKYLAKILHQVSPRSSCPQPKQLSDVSQKVQLLIQELLSSEEIAVGIIFAKERATVAMLREVLVASPPVMQKYRIGTMIGMSNHLKRKSNIYEFDDVGDLATLQSFRSGKINLLIATSVLEEGIDVPVCNLVICFDNPATPKSFIQRRGRARARDSRLVLFEDGASNLGRWEELEAEMKQRYQDEQREFKRLELLEESEEPSQAFFEVESTGARLDFDTAKPHLEHFCRLLSTGEFVDSRPDYIVERHLDSSPPRLSARVLLPSFVPADIRCAESKSKWLSEKKATKDAAFQAYVALYRAKLVNEDLLPFRFGDIPGVESRAPEVDVEAPLRPWHQVATAWKHNEERWFYPLGWYDQQGDLVNEYGLLLPVQLDQPRPIQLFLSSDAQGELRFGPGQAVEKSQQGRLPDHTQALLATHFIHRWPVEERDQIIRISARDGNLSIHQIGSRPFDVDDEAVKQGQYLIRDASKSPFTYAGILPSKPPAEHVQHAFYEYEKAPVDAPYLSLKKWTRRGDFLHPLHGDSGREQPSTKPHAWVLPLSWATVDTIPAKHAQFGMLIPSIVHEIEVNLVVQELAGTLLKSLEFQNLELIREAISSRSASEPLDYERQEFLGDSILKYCASVQAAADHPHWPEGYLSFFKDRLISNSRLSRATLEKGLAKFILTKPFTGQKWRPIYLDDALQDDQSQATQRKLSTKTLADVVEALIGASYRDGGIPKALKCISIFIDDLDWRDVAASRNMLFDIMEDSTSLPPDLAPLEQLIGYSFQKKSILVEATTHASNVADVIASRSFERLEFLGDAILDRIIVARLYAAEPPLPHFQMHLLKTAMVNGDFLAFLTLEHGVHRPEAVVTPDLEIETRDVFLPVWKFMRHASASIGLEQEAVAERYKVLREPILSAMASGTHYPWALLARLQVKKFFSDLFESLLGAVWIDSGSIAVCEEMVTRFGIISYLERILRDGVQVQHPKEEVGKWAVAEPVTYDIEIRESVEGDKEYLCRLLIGDRQVAEVEGGTSKEEVKTKAAEEAVKVLTAEKAALSRG